MNLRFILLAPCYIFTYYNRSIYIINGQGDRYFQGQMIKKCNRICHVLDKIKKSNRLLLKPRKKKEANNVKEIWRQVDRFCRQIRVDREKYISSITEDITSKYTYSKIKLDWLRERGSYLLWFSNTLCNTQ